MYTPHTGTEIREMLAAIGAAEIEDLFAVIPKDLRSEGVGIEAGIGEAEVRRRLSLLAARGNTGRTCFLGGGFYDHVIPAAVDHLAGQSAFVTPYTPYQPEASQGTLQAIYEYQSALCRLTAMEVSNASLYDGGTALCEAALMAARITRRDTILVDGGVHPLYRKLLAAHLANRPFRIVEIDTKDLSTDRDRLRDAVDDATAAVLLANPNFFGTVEDHRDLIGTIHAAGALAVVSCYPLSLGILSPPGEMGADIVTGEGQSLGLPLGFGGPYLGILCATKKLVRNLPGRLVGRTRTTKGTDAFGLTLQTREQHIRREKATSNICSNESLCALRAGIALALLGKQGLAAIAEDCRRRAEYLKERLAGIPGVSVPDHPTFNEFVIELPGEAAEIVARMVDKGILPGLPLSLFYPRMEKQLLVAVTEKRTREELDAFADTLGAVL